MSDGKKANWSSLVGSRCIVIRDLFGPEFEVRVLEVSPSGKRVKFKYSTGSEIWEVGDNYFLIEKLEGKK